MKYILLFTCLCFFSCKSANQERIDQLNQMAIRIAPLLKDAEKTDKLLGNNDVSKRVLSSLDSIYKERDSLQKIVSSQ